MTEFEKMRHEEFYDFTSEECLASYYRAKHICARLQTMTVEDEDYRQTIEELIPGIPESSTVSPPFHCDHGHGIRLGENVFINYNGTMLDGGLITIGRNTQVGPNCQFLTPNHPIDHVERTYYHFQNDNAPVLQMTTRERFFSFVVKTDFTGSHHRFDQCGIVMYLDSENWLKGSVEYENEAFQHLGSVATNNGYSDWATTAIPADVKTMWYRFSRREDDYCIECSADGVTFSQIRICHMYAGGDEIRFGIYACSPEESSFTAVFSDMKITECAWKAHDGQQPDKEH